MKIYTMLWNNEIERAIDGLPAEWVYFEYDSPLDRYNQIETDKNQEEYLCKVNWGEYMRVRLHRLYLCSVHEFDDLFEFMRDNQDIGIVYYRGNLVTTYTWDC